MTRKQIEKLLEPYLFSQDGRTCLKADKAEEVRELVTNTFSGVYVIIEDSPYGGEVIKIGNLIRKVSKPLVTYDLK